MMKKNNGFFKALIYICLAGIIIIGFITVVATGGGGDGGGDCGGNIASLVKIYGEPEEIEKYDSGDYHNHTYWYWCKGFSKTFIWGSYVDDCEQSTYTFSPICD